MARNFVHVPSAITLIMGSILSVSCSQGSINLKSLGPPDLIGEEAGDQGRYYLPNDALEYPWPKAQKTFYYLQRDLKIIFTSNGPQPFGLTVEERRFAESVLSKRAKQEK